MHQLSRLDRPTRGRLGLTPDASGPSTSLLKVLWQRRWMVAGTVVVCVALAAAYLTVATRVFSATAKILVEQNEPAAMGDKHGQLPQSESYVQNQADVFQSAPILMRALEAADYKNMKTFAKAGNDPVNWLRRGGAFKVDVAKKSDVLLISMESPWADEAAIFANSVVNEYIADQSQRKNTAGGEMIAALEKEKHDLLQRRDTCMEAMNKFKRENDVVSFGTDPGNTALARTAALASSLTTAEMNSMQLRAQVAATKKALSDPASLTSFVEAQQFKAKDAGDREYDELRSQLTQQMLALSTSSALEGPNNNRVRTLEAVVSSLRRRVGDKERSMAEAHLASATTQLAVAEDSEQSLRKAMQVQRSQVIGLNRTATEYAKLKSDAARMQKECDLLDGRIGEIKVNELHSAPLNVQFLEKARPEIKPIRPNKLLILTATTMIGWVLGIGLALGQEWRSARFRTPEEILSLLGTSVLATVPRINARLSPVARGQILYLDTHSPSAEAYRSVRTSLHLGAFRDAKTILMASPMSGEGKSTSASNLSIAFAQAGHRTLIVDCDMREPVQHLIFETDGAIGLSSVIAGEEKLRDAIQPTRIAGLYLLPCGPIPANPTELLSGKRFTELMKALVGTFDRIVIDSPPVMVVADARILAASADATMLVLRMGQSMHRAAINAMEELEKVGANVLGTIANDVPVIRTSTYYGGSWQYASSAKRIMASITDKTEAHDDSSAQPRHHYTGQALAIEEPNWSSSTVSSANGESIESKDQETSRTSAAVTTSSHPKGGSHW